MPPAPSKRMAKQLVKTRPGPKGWPFTLSASKTLDGLTRLRIHGRSIKSHMKLTNSLTIKSAYRRHFAPTVVISQIGSTKIYQCIQYQRDHGRFLVPELAFKLSPSSEHQVLQALLERLLQIPGGQGVVERSLRIVIGGFGASNSSGRGTQ